MIPLGWSPDQPPARPTTLRPIWQPGSRPWALAVFSTTLMPGLIRYQLAGLVWVLAFGIAGILVAIGAPGAPALAAAFAAATARAIVVLRRSQRAVVSGPGWALDGTPITGDGFDLLEDIDARFAYAQRMIGEIPTGIAWAEVGPDVDQLRWDSAGEAARLSALDVEIHEMRYAERGSPQHAVLTALKERRAEHVQILKDNQQEAEKLARAAGNAAAAARIALARTGDLARLEVVVPSRGTLRARGALAETRLRLGMLADVWAELDDTGALAAERMAADLDASRQLPPAPRRKTRRPPPG